ncbi:hypothetical protein [Wukongibacter sp. M2B1]|uniref:hypothetical protein n=1 Tax=Wukongibacter sp. M2B1 TaxID=3088895 RepID=UPI003D79B068
MTKKYVLVGENKIISEPMDRMQAMNKVKEYSKEGKKAYIVSEEEGIRIEKDNNFNAPKWE